MDGQSGSVDGMSARLCPPFSTFVVSFLSMLWCSGIHLDKFEAVGSLRWFSAPLNREFSVASLLLFPMLSIVFHSAESDGFVCV